MKEQINVETKVFVAIAMGEFARGILSKDIVLLVVKLSHLSGELKIFGVLVELTELTLVQNNFPPTYNSGIAAKTVSILEILLTLVKRVQPYEILKKGKREKYIFKFRVQDCYLTVGALNKLN